MHASKRTQTQTILWQDHCGVHDKMSLETQPKTFSIKFHGLNISIPRTRHKNLLNLSSEYIETVVQYKMEKMPCHRPKENASLVGSLLPWE